MKTYRDLPLAVLLAVATTCAPMLQAEDRPDIPVSLEACIDMALENNQRRPASQFAVEMAEAQHQQALSAYWPQVDFTGSYSHSNERPNFVFPATSFNVPASTAVVNVPAGVLGASPVSLPVSVPAQNFDIPEINVELLDQDSFTAALDMKWLVYDGGMRKGLREQSQAGIDAAKQASRLTELEIIDSVKRTYYGAVLAKQLLKLGEETNERMEATLNLTETMYKEGAGGVNKTDYLSNKVIVDSIRGVVVSLESNEIMARAALANYMGLSWRDSVTPADDALEFAPIELNMESLVGAAYRFSPNWARMDAGLDAAKGNLRTEKSGHRPRIALMGEVHQYWNSMEDGLSTDENLQGWSVGVGMEVPIFDGFLTRNKVRHAKAKLHQMEAQQMLLEEGIGLQVRHIMVKLNAAEQQYHTTHSAMDSATENRDLNERAYRNGLVETEEVIEAQLIESLMSARHYRICYDYLSLLSELDLVVGTEILGQLSSL
ncbi:TolC family protein [Coraliomargarita sp. W4R72]